MLANIAVTQVGARKQPARGLELPFRCQWFSAPTQAFILDVRGTLSFKGRVLTDDVALVHMNWHRNDLALMRAGADYFGKLFAPLSIEAMNYIEAERGEDDIAFSLTFRVLYQAAEEQKQEMADSRFIPGEVHCAETTANINPVARSAWLKLLSAMEWSEWELIELPTLPFHDDEHLAGALKELRAAQRALRDGENDDALSRCRKAFESAAKHAGKGKTASGFQLLWERAYPDEEAKRPYFDAVVASLSKVSHEFGRHATYPHLSVTRAEALFTVTTTAALLSLIGRQIAAAEVRRR